MITVQIWSVSHPKMSFVYIAFFGTLILSMGRFWLVVPLMLVCAESCVAVLRNGGVAATPSPRKFGLFTIVVTYMSCQFHLCVCVCLKQRLLYAVVIQYYKWHHYAYDFVCSLMYKHTYHAIDTVLCNHTKLNYLCIFLHIPRYCFIPGLRCQIPQHNDVSNNWQLHHRSSVADLTQTIRYFLWQKQVGMLWLRWRIKIWFQSCFPCCSSSWSFFF